jgi:signal transduction histidine kinase
LAAGGDVLRLTVEPIVASGGQRVGYVAWADSTQSLRDLLATVSSALLVGGAFVIVLALAGGLVLARRALAPVADVTETARAISLSGDFAARVEGAQRGDEVGELAGAFNEMLEALELNHQTLQRFLGDASHQLRTPLTTVRANLDLAQRPSLPAAERQAILADARHEAERMGRLIGDLLALARAESGARLEFAPVELDALLVESIQHERQAAPHVRMSVSSVEPAIVDGDRDRLRDLFGVLLDNAVRYTPAGGSVVAALDVRDGRAVVRVEDTGIGLDEADRDRLFERLYRGTRAREMWPSGTGLGLAIARWIVEAHGGTIELAARDRGGTVARVTLPVRSP